MDIDVLFLIFFYTDRLLKFYLNQKFILIKASPVIFAYITNTNHINKSQRDKPFIFNVFNLSTRPLHVNPTFKSISNFKPETIAQHP